MTDAITDVLTRGVTQCIFPEELEKRLRDHAAGRGPELRIKLGIDPTGPQIHVGRAVVLRKLRAFQQLGHQVVLIIGDFTGLVGDASDKDAERPMLTREQIEANMTRYLEQIGRVVDVTQAEVHYNSTWLSPLGFREIAMLAQQFSVAEMLDRDTFSKRYQEGKRISLHEFLYPLMQGYDSVAIRADVELGGNDQYFNLLAGRTLQKAYDQPPQHILCTRLLEGTDGRKMSTSYGNGIFIEDTPADMYGKVMRVKDELMMVYFENATDVSLDEIHRMQDALLEGDSPREMKGRLAREIVTLYHGAVAAAAAEQDFITKFVERETPENIPEYAIPAGGIGIIPLLVELTGFVESTSAARRLLDQGAVSLDGERVEDIAARIEPTAEPQILKVGKRQWARLLPGL